MGSSKYDHVVHDHVGLELLPQRQDVVGEADQSVVGSGEPQRRVGCHVVDQLEHGPTFVGPRPVRRRQLLEHRDASRRQVAEAMSSAALVAHEVAGQALKLSESAPSRMPAPVTPRACTRSAFSSATAWLSTKPAFAMGRRVAWADFTPETWAALRTP